MTKATTVRRLSESQLLELQMDAYAEAVAEIIEKKKEFETVREEAMPAEALSDPLVQEQVKLCDLVWAFDVNDKGKCSLIGGAEFLGYLVWRKGEESPLGPVSRAATPLNIMGFYYDPAHESLDSLRQTVEKLKYNHRRQKHIIKTFDEEFPLWVLYLDEILDPNVREKVAEADAISVTNLQDEDEVHLFSTKAARECRTKEDKFKLKFMAFNFDPKTDSLEKFAAALEEIKGKGWQN